jgi:hypothetical protein
MLRALALVGLIGTLVPAAGAGLASGPAVGAFGWCGASETAADRQDAVAGQQIHVVYAMPADGRDSFSDDAPLIVSDLTAVDAWWRRQDPTRTPRFDLLSDPGCTGALQALDLSSVRLPHDTAFYRPIEQRSDKLRADLAAGFSDPGKKYLVYYDGAVDVPFDCGQSAIAADRGGASAYSFVYLQADGCTHDLGAGQGTAGYAAHELLHNLGAVPDAAPNLCFEHAVCDWYWDVETQFPTGDPLAKLILDYGHDDYYGHSGNSFDVQDSPWLSHVDAPRYELGVSFLSRGQGSVASDLPGISCPGVCSIAWEQDARVVLHATAAPGSRFLHWGGACKGSGACVVTMDGPKAVTATFGPLSLPLRFRGRSAVRKLVLSRAALNPITRENALPGTPGSGSGDWRDSDLQGYTSETSLTPGETLHLHVSTPAGVDYRIELFRLGWYGGVGGRLVACVPSCLGYRSGRTHDPAPTDPATGEVRLSWPVTDQLVIPSDWVSGYYLVRLVPSDGGVRGTIPFILRESPDRPSPILVEVPVNTWEAYNAWGGKSLYDFNSTGGAPANRVSFDRPYLWELPGSQPVSKWELPVVRFLEREGYDVSYATDVDVDRDPGLLLRHRLIVLAGHGEYWTKGMRDAFETARSLGTNLAFLGANIGYWQVRFEDDRRTIVGYKSLADPEPDPALKTILFRDLTPPRPECSLLGVQHYTGSYQWPRGDFQVVAAGDPWFAGTGLTASSTVTGVVSREHDQIPYGDDPRGPCGLAPPSAVLTVLFRHEGKDPLERAEAVRYTTSSGTRVFSAGSLEFAWALDGYRVNGDGAETPVDPRLQAFMRTALADLLRPAPPARVAARRLKRSTRVAVSSIDPRVAQSFVYRHRGARAFVPTDAGVRLVCGGSSAVCLDRARLKPGLYRYAAVVRDEWGQASDSQLSAPVHVPKPKPARKPR